MVALFIDFIENCKTLIPRKIRGQNLVAMLGAMLIPIQSINNKFVQWAKELRYKLSFTGQVIYLEHILNDVFDPVNRLIYIDDPTVINTDLNAIFYKIEDQPVDFVTYYSTGEPNPMPLQEGLYYQSEYTLVPHFIVFVPTSILTASIQINISGIVDYYKIAGKKYTIQPY